jgi:hypothetical protein
MAGLPKALMWRRIDSAGAEQVVLSDRSGLHARGTMVAALPVPFACRYELYTDNAWATARFDATVEGAGFVRTVRLERAAGRWRVTAGEQGDLDAALVDALDVDLGQSPLTNTLPIRRLGLAGAAPGATRTIEVAWVLVPSLEVVESTQTYATLGGGRMRFTSGSFAAELVLDPDGYVRHYPGLADSC